MKFLANKRIFANLLTSLFEKKRIKTTLAKARAIQPMVEKQMTKMKKDRKGGYTRIIKIGKRLGDAAEMALIEFVDVEQPKQEVVTTKKMKETPKIVEADVVPKKKTKNV